MTDTVDYSKLFRLDGCKVLVVGGGSGIGREAAVGLASHGAHVVVMDRDEAAAQDTVERIHTRELSGEAFQLDVLNASAVEAAAKRFGSASALVFTAATNVRKRLEHYSFDEFDRVVNLNLRASFHLIQQFGSQFASHGTGSVVALSSIRAEVVEPGQGVYGATKAGLQQLIRAAAAEFGPQGVRFNTIAPGVVETPLSQQIQDNAQWYRAYAEKSALGRWARADELVGAIVYLASGASSFVTGTTLTVDGGWTAIDGRFTPPGV